MTAMNSDSRGIGNHHKRFQGDLLWEKKRRKILDAEIVKSHLAKYVWV